MENLDDPELNAKVSDSAYSNSCGNSHSRRSISYKSTHSGSNSSGSSGYGGTALNSGKSHIIGQQPKKDKESKKKKQAQAEGTLTISNLTEEPAGQQNIDIDLPPPQNNADNAAEVETPNTSPDVMQGMDCSIYHRDPVLGKDEDGFSCVIAMEDGVVMYMSNSITASLGFSKEVWIGRPFIDFVHQKDHTTFASLSTNGLELPKFETAGLNKEKMLTSMVCRLRGYRNLSLGFCVTEVATTYTPFLLKFYFKNYSDVESKVVYLVIRATRYLSVFKTPNELVQKPFACVLRHAPDGALKYIEPGSAPYIGYLPQDIKDKNVFHMYHPEDLELMRQMYETVMKDGCAISSRPIRLLAQNDEYVVVETELTTVTNPWSMKLEFVIAKYNVIQGPINPDVFQTPVVKDVEMEEEILKLHNLRDSIVRVMTETLTQQAEASKKQVGTRCRDLASFMETLIEEKAKDTPNEEMKVDTPDTTVNLQLDLTFNEKDLVLGGVSPHHNSDSKSSVETQLNYNQLNYNENLQRYFDSQRLYCNENYSSTEGSNDSFPKTIKPANMFSQTRLKSHEINEVRSIPNSLAVHLNNTEDNHCVKITEKIIHKHNAEMEVELVKMHQEKKKKEHLARGNPPALAVDAHNERLTQGNVNAERLRGVKRASLTQGTETHAAKQHCQMPRETVILPFEPTLAKASTTQLTATVATNHWAPPQITNGFGMNILGTPNQMQMLVRKPAICGLPGTHIMSTNFIAPGAADVASLSRSSRMDQSGSPMLIGQTTPSTVAQPGASLTAWPGPSPMSMSGPTLMDQSGPTPVYQPNSPIMAQSGPSHTALMCPYRMTQPGLSAMAQPGLSIMPMQGRSVMPHLGLTTMPQSGIYTMPLSCPSTMPMLCPSTMPLPCPSTMALPGPSTMDLPGPSTMALLGPSTMDLPGPSTMDLLGPSTMALPGPSGTELKSMRRVHDISGMPAAARMPSLPLLAGINGTCPINYGQLSIATSLGSNQECFSYGQGLPPFQGSMPFMGDGQTMSMAFGQPVVYSPIPETVSVPINNYVQNSNMISLPCSYYEQAYDVAAPSATSQFENSKNMRNSDDNVDNNTDGESSYSSFYSSFMNTESGSAEESSGQIKNICPSFKQFDTCNRMQTMQCRDAQILPKNARKPSRKTVAPWNEQVNMTPGLIYKYQIVTKSKEEVLENDKQKLATMEQHASVNEQMEQLYLDLQLQGGAARLTLEEGFTSSSSSGDDIKSSRAMARYKRKVDKLAIIHEENAPFPACDSGFLVPEGTENTDKDPKTNQMHHTHS